MLALGSRCLIGDQLHPDGRIDPHVYALVGEVYAEVARKEPWCAGARPVSEIAVFTPEEFQGGGLALAPAIRGVTRMLEELGHQFDIVDSHSDLGGYAVVGAARRHPGRAGAARQARRAPGRRRAAAGVLRLRARPGRAGLRARRAGRAAPEHGPLPVFADTRHDHCDYLLPRGAIGAGLPETEHAMYLRGLAVEAAGGEVLAERVEPYFDRTWEHFCSHLQTPSSGRRDGPAIVAGDGTVYFAHPVFSQYDANAPRWCKTLVANALALLLPEPLVRHDGPSSLRVGADRAARGAALGPPPPALHPRAARPQLRHDRGRHPAARPPRLRARARRRARRHARPGRRAGRLQARDGRVDVRLPRLDGHALLAFELGEA